MIAMLSATMETDNSTGEYGLEVASPVSKYDKYDVFLLPESVDPAKDTNTMRAKLVQLDDLDLRIERVST